MVLFEAITGSCMSVDGLWVRIHKQLHSDPAANKILANKLSVSVGKSVGWQGGHKG